jgi:hypothetical protein
MVGIGAARQQAGCSEALQAVGEDVRGDALLALREQFAIAAPVADHDVTDDDQAPAIAELSLVCVFGATFCS